MGLFVWWGRRWVVFVIVSSIQPALFGSEYRGRELVVGIVGCGDGNVGLGGANDN